MGKWKKDLPVKEQVIPKTLSQLIRQGLALMANHFMWQTEFQELIDHKQ